MELGPLTSQSHDLVDVVDQSIVHRDAAVVPRDLQDLLGRSDRPRRSATGHPSRFVRYADAECATPPIALGSRPSA